MKKKIIAIICITVVVTVGIFYFLQCLLMPKFMSETKEGAMIAEYYNNSGDNEVIFIGDCEVYENVSPIKLWEDYGITSYIRGSSQQLIWQSYYLLEETLNYETPKVVVFNVLSMKYGTPQSTGNQTTREAYNRMTLDGMRWSSSKWNSILASMTTEEKEKGGMWNYIFPILRYHDRWSQLTSDDWKYLFSRDQVTDNGYLMQTGVEPVTKDYVDTAPHDPLSENSYYYLDKMRELCEEKGVQFVLLKAPSLYPVWFDDWDEEIVEYAEKYDLLYINCLNAIDDIGIDWNEDTYDAGLHLNVYGAEKLSDYLGSIFMDECDLEDYRSNEAIASKWEEKCETYYSRKEELENSQ